jgi:hypothetical protein
MTERQVTIRLDVVDNIGNRLLEIHKQREALMGKAINLKLNADGMEDARQAVLKTRTETAGLMKDLNGLGGALTGKAVAPMAQYSQLAGAALQASRAMGAGLASALKGASGEFQKQKDLAAFWGTSGYMHLGLQNFKQSLSGFLASGGAGFRGWLQNVSTNLTQYRTALAGAAAVMVGFAAAAGLSSKHTQNYIQATLDSRLMERKLSDKEGAKAWIEAAQGADWSAGRASRMGTFQTVLSKNPYIGQQGAQKATEDIEKFFFANQEMLKKKGIESAEDLASRVSAPQLSGEDASVFEDIFGLGFGNMTAQARLGRISTEAKDINIDKAVAMRPDEVLTKRLSATTAAVGDTIVPVLNEVLGGFLKISDAIGKIPGLGKMIGWGTVLAGAASAGLIFVSMIGSLIPGLMTVIGLFSKIGVATKIAAAGQWLLNAAMTANPLGIAIVAIAGLVAGLYLLEQKFGLVTKAWQAFSGSSIGKGILGAIDKGKEAAKGMLADLGKAWGGGGWKGAAKVGLELITNSSPLFKIISLMADYIKKLWMSGETLKKLFQMGLGLWQKMIDFFNWLLQSIKNGVQWIKDGLGITKSEKKADMEKIAKQEGLTWNENKKAWFTRSGAETSPSAALTRAQSEYENAPGSFFEGIPGISDLTKAIGDLNKSLEARATAALQPSMNAVNAAAANLLGTNLHTGETPSSTSTSGKTAYPSTDYPGTWDLFDKNGVPYAQAVSEERKNSFMSMDVGGSIIASGGLLGHRGEEVDPARVVAGGKTTLERISELVQGRNLGTSGISINAPVSVQISVDKLDSNMDIERLAHRIGTDGANKLMFALRNGLNNGQLRDIGYLRG